GVILGQTDSVAPGGLPPGYVPALYVDTSGSLRACVFWHNSGGVQIVATGSYTDGRWHHVVDTLAGGTETLYIDGAQKGTLTGLSQTGYSPSSNYLYFLGTGYTAPVWIGTPATAGWWYFPGAIDEFATYSTGLSATRVLAHFA